MPGRPAPRDRRRYGFGGACGAEPRLLGAPLAGDTTGASASSDGHAAAFAQQAGDGRGASTISVRNRQVCATTTVGNGQLPSVTGDGTKVAFALCTGPDVSLWNGTAATLLTSGQWRQGGADTIKRLDISLGGATVVHGRIPPPARRRHCGWPTPTVRRR